MRASTTLQQSGRSSNRDIGKRQKRTPVPATLLRSEAPLRILAAAVMLGTPWAAQARSIAAWQQRTFTALARQNVISPYTKLVSLKPVCTLAVGGKDWQVIDLIEHVPGDQSPRGRNRIVLLDRALKLVHALDYTSQYPMACVGSRLYVFGDYGVDNSPPYGNVLDFSPDGEIAVTNIEANDLPIPLTGQRRTFRLP
ncbi:MAG: hypothetical protein QM690_21525 [Sphingobium sp.]